MHSMIPAVMLVLCHDSRAATVELLINVETKERWAKHVEITKKANEELSSITNQEPYSYIDI